jgi:glucose/arabinose dehydrogenase
MRRGLVVVTVVALAATVLAGCRPARAGTRCWGGVARDATHVLVCKNGRWRRGPTIRQMAVLLVDLARRQEVPELTVTPVAGGLANPWEVAFTSEGVMLVTERSGSIDAVIDGAVRVLARPADVEAVGEAGMMGLAVDPGFAQNRRIYTCFRSRAGGTPDVRVVRWVVDPAYGSLTERADIVTGIPTANTHNGCRLGFGPDGALWVTTGDATIGAAPQNPTSLAGKVLRVTTDGSPAPGNPGGGWDPRVFTRGHRNPQGIAFRPGTGQAYAVEHGPTTDDEVNRLVPGGNYGWAPLGAGGAYDQGVPMTDPRLPGGAIGAVWSSGSPTIAPSGATFLSGPQWKGWDGALAVAVLKGRHLRVFRLDGPGTRVTDQWSVVGDRGRLRTAVQGPDGNLYLTTDANPGQVLRVTPR